MDKKFLESQGYKVMIWVSVFVSILVVVGIFAYRKYQFVSMYDAAIDAAQDVLLLDDGDSDLADFTYEDIEAEVVLDEVGEEIDTLIDGTIDEITKLDEESDFGDFDADTLVE